MRAFVPDGLPPGAPLLVALHGCTQTAAGFDRGCGWSDLAARLGFALLMPEQCQANNPRRCFNWFDPAHTARGAGEGESIHQMVRHMLGMHQLDPRRVFVTGLSAGGAMACVMLATRPEVFAAGAVIAGLPYGAAKTVQQAFEAMTNRRPRSAEDWARRVRAASPHHGPWPRISIWQGGADTTVNPINAWELVKQWTVLHGLTARSEVQEETGHLRRVWRGPDGTPLVELHTLPDLVHGVPIRPGRGEGCCGQAMPFILDVGVSAPHEIARFFGLTDAAAAAPRADAVPPRPVQPQGQSQGQQQGTPALPGVVPAGTAPHSSAPAARDGRMRPGQRLAAGSSPPGRRALDPGTVIRRALAAAGLLKP